MAIPDYILQQAINNTPLTTASTPAVGSLSYVIAQRSSSTVSKPGNPVFPYQLDNITYLRQYSSGFQTNNNNIAIGGYYVPYDNGGGTFVWNANSTATDDGAVNIKPNNISGAGRWIRQFSNNQANVTMWGAKGDGFTDDTPAIQNAINYCSLSGIPNLYFNAKTYFLSSFSISNYGVYEPSYLGLGNYPGSSTMVNINLYGGGATLSANNLTFVNGTSGIRSSIFGIIENINNCTIDGFTLVNDGYLCGDNANAGIAIRGNSGGSFGWGVLSNYAINRNIINITNNTFINCHRAISNQSSYVSGGGINTLNVNNNFFFYPKGSDSKSTAGGSQIFFNTNDTKNLNAFNNYVEGSSYYPPRCPNGLPKDGFIFFGGLVNRVGNNTFARLGVESLYMSTGWSGFSTDVYDLSGNSIARVWTMPAVGQSITFNNIPISTNTWQSVDGLTANGGFGVGSYVVITGGTFYTNGTGGTDNTSDGGIYQITSYPYRGSTGGGATSAISIQMTRVSGVDVYPFNLLANSRTNIPGLIITGGRIYPYNPSFNAGVSSFVTDNVFTIGLASSANGNVYLAHNPAVRADSGYNYLSGNKVYAGVYPAWNISDPRSNWLVERNDFYLYNEQPVEPSGPSVTHYVDGIASVSPLNATIRNNNLHFWVDINGNTATTVNSAVPQTYINNPPNYQPTYYTGFGVNYAYVGWGSHVGTTSANPLTGQTMINNISYCSVPTMSGMIVPIAGAAGSGTPAVNGLDTTSNIFNFVSGNTIVFGS
jgi:hypothetical protein